jgi:excisionase family DNA binding protein
VTAVAEAAIEPGTYSVREAARRLGIGKDLAYELIARRAYPFDGTIPVLQYGRRKRIPIVAVERHLEGQAPQSP